VSVADSNGIISANGIAFPATQSASANVNTLDDYEEGTWTPVAVGSTTPGTATYSVQNGQYTKIGNRVFYSLYIVYSGGTGTGGLRIGGLPFNSSSSGALETAAMYVESLALTANNIAISYVGNASTFIVINQTPVGGGAASDVTYDSSAVFLISGHYRV